MAAFCDPIGLRNELASLNNLPRQNRDEFVRAFIGGASVVPGDARLDVQMRTLPAIGVLRHSNSACGLVAGAGSA